MDIFELLISLFLLTLFTILRHYYYLEFRLSPHIYHHDYAYYFLYVIDKETYETKFKVRYIC